MYGQINGHLIGIAMKEMARRAIERIRAEMRNFEVFEKPGKDGKRDIYTTADTEAQKVYLKLIRESFPLFGVVAEEDGLRIACQLKDRNLYFTVDPLDGTKAYERRASDGIGTMISLCDDESVLAAVIGDVMTREMYYFRPDSDKVHRLSDFGKAEALKIDKNRTLKSQAVMLRDEPDQYSPLVRKLVKRGSGAFKQPDQASGSIGTTMAKLWKGEVGAAILHGGKNTPWDLNPVLGLCTQLGFGMRAISLQEGRSFPLEMTPQSDERVFANEVIVLHHSRIDELEAWFRSA